MRRVLFSIFILVISISLAQAQFKPESGLLMFNVGFTTATPEDSDNSLSGNSFTLSYEKSNYQGNLSGGVAISYGSASSDSLVIVNDAGGREQRANSANYEVLPILLFGKFLFGSPKAKGYIGGGIGIQFSNFDYITENGGQVSASDSGFLVGGMAGLNFYPNEKLVLNGSYNYYYLGNSYFKDGSAHAFSIGLGFQLN